MGWAIRNNVGNLYAMKKAVYAILFHFTDITNTAERHQFCPRDSKSWCKYWSKSKTYKPSNSIHVWIKNLLLLKIKSLQADDLLKKCLHGKTQNANEAINSVIGYKVPNTTFVGKDTIEMGAHSAVLNYNDGHKGILKVLNTFDCMVDWRRKKTKEENKNSEKWIQWQVKRKGNKRILCFWWILTCCLIFIIIKFSFYRK